MVSGRSGSTVSKARHAAYPVGPTDLADRQQAGLDALLRLADPWLSEEIEPLPTGPARRSARWPLLLILAIQLVLSVRLVGANTAFQDEALYLTAGHLEISHLFGGASIPAFATYFSGAPVVYPPVGAALESIGGLTAARLLSTAFMLGATALLWGVSTRLFGRRAGMFAAGIFALLGPTLFLGSLATYDAAALFLLAMAAWCAVGGRDREDAAGWMIASGTALVLANVTAYATILFDPVVILLTVLAATPEPKLRRALARGGMIIVHVVAIGAVVAVLAGSYYRTGLAVTTTARASGDNTILSVLIASATGMFLPAIVAVLGVCMAFCGRARFLGRPALPAFALAAFLVPASQARVHTLVSLNKHVDIGAWFACAAAGFALSRLTRTKHRSVVAAVAVGVCAVLFVQAWLGVRQSEAMTGWPGSAGLISTLRPLTGDGGRFLAENSSIPEYYLPATSWRQWSNTFSITQPSGEVRNEKGQLAPYATAIRKHYFRLVVLDFRSTPGLDAAIEQELRAAKNYRIVAKVPFGHGVPGHYVVWEWEKPAAGAKRPGHGTKRQGHHRRSPGAAR
jgi:4-amino-4-deoxy-L-arabinose transferase-like glycosyltransferase